MTSLPLSASSIKVDESDVESEDDVMIIDSDEQVDSKPQVPPHPVVVIQPHHKNRRSQSAAIHTTQSSVPSFNPFPSHIPSTSFESSSISRPSATTTHPAMREPSPRDAEIASLIKQFDSFSSAKTVEGKERYCKIPWPAFQVLRQSLEMLEAELPQNWQRLIARFVPFLNGVRPLKKTRRPSSSGDVSSSEVSRKRTREASLSPSSSPDQSSKKKKTSSKKTRDSSAKRKKSSERQQKEVETVHQPGNKEFELRFL